MAGMTVINEDLAPEDDIPTGLNRIKIREGALKDSVSFKRADSGVSSDRKQKPWVGQGHVKAAVPREGQKKGKKASWWSISRLFKNQDYDEYREQNTKTLGMERTKHKLQKMVTHPVPSQSSAARTATKVPNMKSFSQELGPKGGVQHFYPRAHSYNDLKALLESVPSRFDAAKEVVNSELACFTEDIKELLELNDSLSSEAHKTVKDLLILGEQCIGMSSLEFRIKCETVVQDLTEKRKQCHEGVLKWLCTHMLFILTRCTRLLHFERDTEPLDNKSLHRLKKCLDNVPSVEMIWDPDLGNSKSGGCFPDLMNNAEKNLQRQKQVPVFPAAESSMVEVLVNGRNSIALKDPMAVNQCLPAQNSHDNDMILHGQHVVQDNGDEYPHDTEEKAHNFSSNWQEQCFEGADLVICRICEDPVPALQLESHSYICAYADKSDTKGLDIDDRLVKLADMLEQVIESFNISTHESNKSTENSVAQMINSFNISEVFSPKMTEWRSKGVEGMFEDLHDMDTACLDDSHVATLAHLRSYLGMKLGHCGPPSSSGSISSSSCNTPRTGHFDSFWVEQDHPSESEDVQHMINLSDIAHSVAGTDTSKLGSIEYLLACMEDLQDVLKQSKVKALVIDTFGSRIENLLREKYILACEVVDSENLSNNSRQNSSKSLLDNVSFCSTVSTPLHLSHKERTSIDDFHIIKPISRGAFGKVFLARKRTTGDLFAIKVLKKLNMIRKNDVERILAERNILITVRNPFVVRFYYSFTSRDKLYLVMEYLNGGDFYSLLRKVGCLEEDIARIYMAELVLALEYLHSLGIVHRDLKPDNILIAQDGHIKTPSHLKRGKVDFSYCKRTKRGKLFKKEQRVQKLWKILEIELTDFGLSKIGLMNSTGDLPGLEREGFSPSVSQSNLNQQRNDVNRQSAVGTPDYLAPEILLGTEHGYAADWWSVGIILFEFITGIPPFTAGHPEMIFDNILNRKIPWPLVPGDMSYEAQDLIDRFLVHDPEKRLGAKGSAEVKLHPFFRGINWDNLAQLKAAFVPHLDSVDDTSYFVPRYTQLSAVVPEHDSDDSASETSDSVPGSEKMDDCGDLEQFGSTIDLSMINFSFKNLSQLASINRDVLLQNWKDPSKCSSPSKASGE